MPYRRREKNKIRYEILVQWIRWVVKRKVQVKRNETIFDKYPFLFYSVLFCSLPPLLSSLLYSLSSPLKTHISTVP
jgi:hypothetical protein